MLKNNFNKRGQITIFIIIAVLLVAAIILLFWFYNRDVTPVQPDAGENPQYNIEHCINSYVEKDVNKLIENSGYIKKSNLTKNFNGQDIPYLCFVPINYARCIVVEPVLIEHLEKEIYNDIKTKIAGCFNNLESEAEKSGYSVNMESGINFSINLIPGDVQTIINKKITLSKAGEVKKFNEFEAKYHSNLYGMAIITQEITRQESSYCGSDYANIMRTNTWAEIDKFQTGDDNKIYTIKDTTTNDEIKFAVRGCVLNTPS